MHGIVMCLALLFGYERDELYVRKVLENPLARAISYEYINFRD